MQRLFIAGMYTLLLLLSTLESRAQQTIPSPRDSAFLKLDTNVVSVNYGRPSMRGRTIMGDLVPWNKVWRTGANQATHFKTSFDLMMDGVPVTRGTYTLWTIPSPDGWTLILNKQTGQWGTKYDETQDYARFPAKVEQLSTPVEQFTISLEPTGPASGVMKLMWENTLVSTTMQKSNKIRPLSPPDSTTTTIGGATVSVRYSKPFIRGRKIWGAVVPMDSIWRTGANAATLLTTDANLMIGTSVIPKGAYTIYSLPTERSYDLIISKKPAGNAEYDITQDLVRVPMTREKSSKTIDPFTIWFEKGKNDTSRLMLGWADRIYAVEVRKK